MNGRPIDEADQSHAEVGSGGMKPTREECMRAAARVFLQIAIRVELERRAAEAAQAEKRG